MHACIHFVLVKTFFFKLFNHCLATVTKQHSTQVCQRLDFIIPKYIGAITVCVSRAIQSGVSLKAIYTLYIEEQKNNVSLLSFIRMHGCTAETLLISGWVFLSKVSMFNNC